MKNSIFWDVMPCGSFKKSTFLRKVSPSSSGRKESASCEVLQLLVTVNVPRSLILFTLMLEEISSSETLVSTRATQCHIPEDSIYHSHLHANLKTCKSKYIFVWQHSEGWTTIGKTHPLPIHFITEQGISVCKETKYCVDSSAVVSSGASNVLFCTVQVMSPRTRKCIISAHIQTKRLLI
jgi:hypothetical protein